MRRIGDRHARLYGAAWFVFVICFLCLMFTVTFYVSQWIFGLLGLDPHPLLAQIITSLLGLVFTGLAVGVMGAYARKKGWFPEMQIFGPIIEALERIAKGDFSVRVDNEFKDHQVAGELANTVNRMALELDQMETIRQEFVSNVSHEIQSPLTSIRGFAQALKNNELDEEDRLHYLEIIEIESTRLSRLANDLLKLSSLEIEQAKYAPKLYRLDQQIRSLILTCELQWQAKHLEITADLNEVELNGDEGLLSQVWLNLLHNSIKFTPPEGAITLALRSIDDNIEVRIADNGIGISPDDQAHIFERFYKADKSRTRSNGGSGLGLAIAKKIIEMHQGTIAVESVPDEGTMFIVRIPNPHVP